MIIGIDIRTAIGEKAGIGNYTYNLVKNLAEIDKKNYYILYITKDNDLQYVSVKDMSVNVLNGIAFFTDELFNGDYKTIQTSVYVWTEENNYSTSVIDIYLINADEHSYKYFYSTKMQISSKFNPFSEPVMVYSNITNGYGIIGSYSVSKNTLVIP